MASASGRKPTKSRTSTKGKTNARSKKTTSRKGKGTRRKEVDVAVKNEVMLIAIFAMAIFVFLCVAGIIQGRAAIAIANVMFGLFGLLAYLIPILIFLAFAFGISNKGNTVAMIKLISAGVLVFLIGIIAYMLIDQESFIISESLMVDLYKSSSEEKAGGGVLFGLISHGLYQLIGLGGTLFLVVVLGIISIVFITEKSFLSGLRKGGSFLIETAKEDVARRREYWESMEVDEEYEYDEELERKRERVAREKKQEKVRRSDMKVRGVASISSTALPKEKNTLGTKSDMHEIILTDDIESIGKGSIRISSYSNESAFNEVSQEAPQIPQPVEKSFLEELTMNDSFEKKDKVQENYDLAGMPEPVTEATPRQRPVVKKTESLDKEEVAKEEVTISQQIQQNKELQRPYMFPPISLLKKGEGNKGDSPMQLKETAYRLQQTLQNFGVRVTVTDISQGPSVTRYELQPEQGVKVSKIVGLADDIKLNLAATDIRIEAPIPGKAAVGIEVPNKENSAVAFRDLLESKEFKDFPSNLTFAVGKDIGGQVVVTDIAKMPHMLIAGATGSGKSVCINTIIMSILYKANPDDVKLIMIDPKVVELSVYNGIPHLMIPVVTDPKKASAALHWGVAEMTERYKKFADLNVRDLKGYNKAVESGKLSPEGEPLQKMPQIVIIVDELADLMMVAAGEVEESICRLAQLARAAGIHLIIATQRPSVDVITGLIKANMPSRVAFSVSSGVDSRTILDMNGAEKLLGKGDMLFYPQGYAKPARIQGAFVSDSEVYDVVEFLKNQRLGNTYDNGIEEKIKTMQTPGGAGCSLGGGSSNVDEYFADAGKFVIEKDKASIGMLQRVFKIGFNRAARIVDQLEEAGVVGAEEGTKPRKVLMSMEQFENYLEETV